MVLERCERKILLGWLLELPNRVYRNPHLTFFFYELEANVNKRQTGLASGLTASKAFTQVGLRVCSAKSRRVSDGLRARVLCWA